MKLYFNMILVTFFLISCNGVNEEDAEEVDTETEVGQEAAEDEEDEDTEGKEDEEDEDTERKEEATEEVTEEEFGSDIEGELTVHFIDVGQGDAVLLETEDEAMMVDFGDYQGDEVVPYLNEQEIEDLDLAVATHPHADHIGQLDTVLHNDIDIDEVWMNGEEHDTQTFERVLDAVLESEADYDEPRAGDTYELGEAAIEVVHPTELTGDVNNDSIVLNVGFGDVHFLLTGDAETEAESEMVASDFNLNADILKVGHHGSDTSSTSSFLNEVNPDVSIYMAGEDNTYGHPHEEALSRIENTDSDIYGTDIHGHVIVSTDGESYNIETVEDSEPTTSSEAPPEVDEVDEGSEEESQEETDSTEACEDGDVAINAASDDELQEIVEIGDDRAEQIMDLRESQEFESYSDLTRIDGIADARADTIEDQGIICFD